MRRGDARRTYRPPYERLQERWRLSDEQQALRSAVQQDIAERWPRLNFDVAPVHKLLKRGDLLVPDQDAWFEVGYMNGPLLMDMRKVIAGRTRICGRVATIGAVLWVAAQARWWSQMIGMDGRSIIQPFDLSPEPIAHEVNAIDSWAHDVGLMGSSPSVSVGAHLFVEASDAARQTGVKWPTATDIQLPDWPWHHPSNAIHPPRPTKA